MSREVIEMICKDETIVKGLSWSIKEAIGNVVIITGMEEHSGRYDDFAKFLNKNGYSVFCIDHFCQGENAIDIADLGQWQKSGFRKMVNVVDQLVEKLRITCRPTYLFGHSLGSFIAQDYIQRYSSHIEKVILCGSCGPRIATRFGSYLARLLVRRRNYSKKSKFLASLAIGSFNKKISPKRTASDWLSYNEANVDAYIADEKCGYGSTGGFYKEFFKGLNRLSAPRFLKKIRKSLPILIVSGKDDPVGLYGKGVIKLENVYKKLDIENVEMKLYDHMRHEILFEDDREMVYQDILTFLKK